MIVLIYLCSIIAANLLSATYGPVISVLNSFLFIGMDMTIRDRLHDKWEHKNLKTKMALLIMTGSVLSYAINRDAANIAIASTVAFCLSMVADYLAYSALAGKHRFFRINGSNVVSSAVDSYVFPLIAFGSVMPLIVVGQFLAKTLGGFVWSLFPFKKLALAAVVMFVVCDHAQAGDMQAHYDFSRDTETLTVEHFSPGSVSVYYFVDFDFKNNISSIYGEGYISKSLGGLTHLDIGLNGGLNEYSPIGQCILVGFGYGPLTAYARINDDASITPQLTATFSKSYGISTIQGFIDIWVESGDVVILAEPQLWFSVFENISLGTEVEVSNNFGGSVGFDINPTIAIKYNF